MTRWAWVCATCGPRCRLTKDADRPLTLRPDLWAVRLPRAHELDVEGDTYGPKELGFRHFPVMATEEA